MEEVGQTPESPEQIASVSTSESNLAGLSTTPLVTARGTENGLILRLDGRAAKPDLRNALDSFVNERKGFLKDTEISLEWVGEEPAQEFLDEVSASLKDQFNVRVRSSKLFQRFRPTESDGGVTKGSGQPESNRRVGARDQGEKAERESHSLFDGIESVDLGTAPTRSANKLVRPDEIWDDADSRLICGTLRSGQRLETEHTMVICGDVNSGAEVVAGGDIIVLGTLRGVAHAGAYDETGGGRFIFALDLRPTQLRIGSVINRGASEGSVRGSPEIARVDADSILVERYQSRQIALSRATTI